MVAQRAPKDAVFSPGYALSRVCCFCGVAAGSPCVTGDGRVSGSYHKNRGMAVPVEVSRAAPATSETVDGAFGRFIRSLVIGSPFIILLVVNLLTGHSGWAFLLGIPSVLVGVVVFAAFSSWRDEVEKLQNPVDASERPTPRAMHAATVQRTQRSPRMSRGQFRYVLRRSTGYRMGNNRGRRLY